MKTINWKAAWWATRWFLFAMGAIALVAFFYSRPGWLIGVPAAVLLAGVWYVFYKLKVSWRPTPKQLPRQETGAVAPSRAPAPAPVRVTVVRPAELLPQIADVTSALVNMGYEPKLAQQATRMAGRGGESTFETIFAAAVKSLANPRIMARV